MRKPFIIANWKMNKSLGEAQRFVRAIKGCLPNYQEAEIGIAPQAFAIPSLVSIAGNSNLEIIAQNAAAKVAGAYTGEISMGDIHDIGVKYVIIGHLERRRLFHETNQIINEKVSTALSKGITPIICVDESNTELKSLLNGLTYQQLKKVVISCEPTWAVGKGHQANNEMAEKMCQRIRQAITNDFGRAIAQQIRILYGGSVNPSNIADIMNHQDIDGVLIGRASLDEGQFIQMVNYQKRMPEVVTNFTVKRAVVQ